MRRSQTLTGKPFYYDGDLTHGLIVHTCDAHGHVKANVMIPIAPDTVGMIKHEIKLSREIAMGACRDNPSRGSLGFKLKQHRTSPQHLSYVIPLLVEEGFCTAYRRGSAFFVRYAGR